MRKPKKNIYEGFSLVEMIITIFILGVVMVISATTLTTLIKISSLSEAKNVTRTDVDFVLEIASRSLNSANLEDIKMYDSSGVRGYNSTLDKVENTKEDSEVNNAYSTGVEANANEVHVRSYGFNRWTCIGFFKDTVDTNIGYIVKTSVPTLEEPKDCFDPANSENNKYLILLNSESVNITEFFLSKIAVAERPNSFITVDISAEPIHWPVNNQTFVNREVTKQVTVSTQGLTWYY